MSDPAIEAVSRARANWNWFSDPPELLVETAAREALAPLRKLHRPTPNNIWCAHCEYGWPCDSARLIYPESELT